MSTILKALRRLEEEKSQQERPGLRESVVASSPAQPRRVPFFFVACAVLALGIAGFSWWQLRQLPPPAAVNAVPRPLPALAEPTPVPPPAAQPVAPKIAEPTPPPVAPTPRQPDPPVQAAKATPAPGRPVVAAPADPPVAAPAPAPASSEVAEEPIWAQEVATVKPRPAAAPPPSPAVAPPSARAAAPKPKPMAKVPVPEVAVLQTLWHPLPDRRSATVRLQGEEGTRQMSEGDSVRGLVLLKIEPSGVVFAHHGVQIERRVGR